MDTKKQLGLFGLIGIVIGSVIGGGIFNAPKEIAFTSSIGASLISWAISGIGVFFIVRVFQILTDERPELNDGIYKYAQVGFGDCAGFSSAWGYWLACVVSNASYPILIVQTLTYFFPWIGGIRTIQGIFLGSLLLWGMTYLGIMGMRTVAIANNLATLGKVSAILMAIVIILIGFKYQFFIDDFFGKNLGKGDIFTQVKGCMLQTLWALIGVEGAIVVSGRAKKKSQVSIATMAGYIIALFLYVAVVSFSYGVIPAEKLGELKDPALAYVVEAVVGKWGAILMNISLLISVFGAWTSWTVIAAEIPYNVAEIGLFPKYLGKENERGAASGALIFNGFIKQIAFLFSLFASNAYLVVTNSATALIVIPYVFSAMFLIKISEKNKRNRILGTIATIYGVWMVYAGGNSYLIQTFFIYLTGIVIYIFLKKWRSRSGKQL